jgi:general secretion pathway protein K
VANLRVTSLSTASRPSLRQQRGVAIVTALLIVAIIATATAFLAFGQQLWLRQAQNLADRAQADGVRSGALQWAAVILMLNAKDNTTDDLTQPWAQPLPPLPAEGGALTGKIIDAQGRFNLNNVVRQGKPSTEDIALLQRLLQSQGLPVTLADAVVDWIDADSQARPNGAEDIDYLSMDPPYRAANQPLQSVGELRMIKGFDADAVNKLRPYVSALPAETAINVNTAPAPVLGAMFAEISPAELSDLVAKRGDQPFKDVEDFKKRVPTDLGLPKVPYDVKSSYFEVDVITLFGRLQRHSLALLQRPVNGPVTVLWQQQALAATESSGGTTKTE